MTKLFKRIFIFCASYGFAIVLLTFLLLLTLFGTLEQVDQGLYMVQKKYFESYFVVHDLFGVIPLPLPGVYLLLALLFINLVCGAIIRAPKNWRQPGMLIAHFGIIFLVLAGFVTYHFSSSGYMRLYEHQSANEYVSYYDWEIAITEYEGEKAARQFTIPNDVLADLAPTTVRTLYHAELPFELQISGFAPNAAPRLAPQDKGAVDGVIIERLKLDTNAEANIAGAYILVAPKSGEPMKGILWGGAIAPWLVTVGGKDYALDLRHTRTEVPFTIRLDKFIRELHPRTGIASNFESEVTKTEGEISRQVDIKMNEPLRHRGYTFFQASWGPENAGPNDKLFSVFSVVRNPADQWPLYACLIISGGLLVHFLQKLFRYLRAENRRHA